jgi:hypothetical protein
MAGGELDVTLVVNFDKAMPQIPADQLIPFLIQTALLPILIVRIWTASLQRIYPFFFSYLVFSFVAGLFFFFIPYQSRAYAYFYLVSEALTACFYVLIVMELYRVGLRDLPGIATVMRRYIRITIAIAIVISLLLLFFEQVPVGFTNTLYIFERALGLSVVLFVLLMTAFLVYYPVPLNSNVVAYSIGYAVYFLTKASGLFVRTLGHNVMRQVSTLLMCVLSACLLYWIFSLSKEGERKTVVIGHRWNPHEEQDLLRKLKAINSHLLGAAKSNDASSD